MSRHSQKRRGVHRSPFDPIRSSLWDHPPATCQSQHLPCSADSVGWLFGYFLSFWTGNLFVLQKVWEQICCFFRLWEVWVSAPCTFHWRSSDKIWSSIQSIRLISIDLDWYRLISIGIDWFKFNSQPGERWRPCLQRCFQSPWKCWAKMASEAAQPWSSISVYASFHPLTSFPPRIDKSYFPSSALWQKMLQSSGRSCDLPSAGSPKHVCSSSMFAWTIRASTLKKECQTWHVTWSNNSCDLFLKSRL